MVYGYVGSLVVKQTVTIRYVDREDLHQEGEEGALIALRKYNSRHASRARYVTYSGSYIFKKVYAVIRQMRHIVHVPDRQHDFIAGIARVMAQPDSSQLTDSQNAAAAGVTPTTYRYLKMVANYRTELAIAIATATVFCRTLRHRYPFRSSRSERNRIRNC